MKTCNLCGVLRPLSEFCRNRTSKGGRHTTCKRCACARAKQWREKNLERAKETKRRWYARNRGQYLKKTRQYALDHPEQVKATKLRYRDRNRVRERVANLRRYHEHKTEYDARSRRFYANNKSKVLGWQRRYRQARPEVCRAATQRRRARKLSVREVFTAAMDLFLRKNWKNKCAVCGKRTKLTVDHWLPLSKGHALTMDNAVLLCGSCNSSKGAKLPEDRYKPKLVARIEKRIMLQIQQWELQEC